MAVNAKTFGGAISEARKAKGWALKDLASRVLREDKEAISPQYLNDIEHDRRSPSSDRMVQQFADALEIDRERFLRRPLRPLLCRPITSYVS